jgi:H+-transporting ATPase
MQTPKTRYTAIKDETSALPAETKAIAEESPAGLTQKEAERRITQYGYNEIPEERVHPLFKLLSNFWGPIPWMIEAAAVLSALVQHWPDFTIIMVLLVANAAVGFYEEYQAGNAIMALKSNLALKARVRRDGQWIMVTARELVPGDVIRLHLGDIVPADAKLLDGDAIEVDQSALTGESLPVTKETGEKVYSGSIVRQGEIDALVKSTGPNSYFGKTAQLMQETETVSHFQRAVLKIGDYLILIAIALVALILLVALFRGTDFTTTLQFALVLTVAAIPVAMPTVLSVTMAVESRILAAKEAIVSRLAAIEELAGIDVLCSDKTGTLTQNKLTLGNPFCVNGVSREEVILSAALASRIEDQDSIDLAVFSGLADKRQLDNYRILHYQAFDPVRKRSEASVSKADKEAFKITKGAPQVILELASNADQVRSDIDKAIMDFAQRGFRSLGVARTDKNGQWQLMGIIPLYDPPREDSKTTIAAAREMGINVKMVTGDQLAIGKEIASQLGLGKNIIDAAGFGDTRHHETSQLAKSIERADGFAQVFPEHKFHVVDVLQKLGHIVGMTGDGVNDAPALKKADAGIAVSGATDAARAAADVVLLNTGLTVVIDAIKESRKAFQRMNSYAIYRITETIRVLLFMTLSILLFNFYPVTAAMIVLLALLNDGPILSIAWDNVDYANQPESWNMRLVLEMSTILGVAGVIASFGLFYLGLQTFHLSRELLQTFMFLKLAVAGHLTIFVTRTKGPFWSSKPSPPLLWSLIITKLVATFAAVYGWFMMPIGWTWALVIWGYAIVWLIVNDRIKLAAYRILDPHQSLLGRSLRASTRNL